MSSQPKKKTLAQMRAEKEHLQENLMNGCKLAEDMVEAFLRWRSKGCAAREEKMNEFLDQANRAVQLLQRHTGVHAYRYTLYWKARIHFTLMVATLREADDLFVAMGSKELSKEDEDLWRQVIAQEGFVHVTSHQLEPAKRCFQ